MADSPVGKSYAATLNILSEIPPEGGGSPGAPTHPIALPGDPWWGGDLKPTHPIVIPTPPPDPPLVIWGPSDPRPSPPIYLPPDGGPMPPLVIWGGGNEPFPSHPISGIPGLPGYEPPAPGESPTGVAALVIPIPPSDPPETPSAPPAGSTKAYLWFGPGTVATQVWIPPFGTPKPGRLGR